MRNGAATYIIVLHQKPISAAEAQSGYTLPAKGLKDAAFALAPLNQAEAEKMIRKTWAGRKLKGFRSISPVDEESVIDVLIKLSHLAMEHETIEEINPLRVLSKGAAAVDVRVKLRA